MNVEVFLTNGDVITFNDVESIGETGVGDERLPTAALVVDGRYFRFETYFVGPATISVQNATELGPDGNPIQPYSQ
jgi:hypothetical protein